MILKFLGLVQCLLSLFLSVHFLLHFRDHLLHTKQLQKEKEMGLEIILEVPYTNLEMIWSKNDFLKRSVLQ
jgi:hypothetical protein